MKSICTNVRFNLSGKKMQNIFWYFTLFLLVIYAFFVLSPQAYASYADYNPDGKITCTKYAWQYAQSRGYYFPDTWGDGGDWYANATNEGYYPTDNIPTIDSIACWSKEHSPKYGHVAYVVDVGEDYIDITEGGSGWPEASAEGIGNRRIYTWSTYGNKSLWPDQGFIHLSKYNRQEKQIMANAQGLLDHYANMNEYINWLANEQHYYRTMLNNADCYRNAYTSIMSYGTALTSVGLYLLNGDDVLIPVVKEAKNTVTGELNCYLPEMTTEEFIYSQARMGVDDIVKQKLFDIQNEMEDGRFVTPESAVRFIQIYQQNKAAFAAAEMGRQYYYNELNKSVWDHIGSLFTSVATCQLSELIKATGADFDTGALADELLNMLGLVADCYDNEYVNTWMDKLRNINSETETLFAPELANTFSSAPVIPIPKITVTFDGNGGSVGLNSRSYEQNETFGYLPTPFRFGYDFLGWYDASGTRAVYTANSVASTDLALYAQWSRTIIDSGSCGDHLTYALYGDGVLEIIGYGDMTSAPWRNYAGRVGEVVLPAGLTSIAYGAFAGCKYVHEIAIPAGVKTIGYSAFENSGLQSLTLPEGIEELGYRILAGNTGVTEIVIPGSVNAMDYYVDYYNSDYHGVFTDSAIKRAVIMDGVKTIGSYTFYNARELTEIVLPNTLKTINGAAFGYTALTSLTLPASVKTIGDEAFANSGLQSLVLPDGVEELGCRILAGNTGVTEIVIPGSVKTMRYYDYHGSGYGVFTDSAIRRAVIMDGVTTIGLHAFYNTKQLDEVVLPSTLTTIGHGAFDNTALTTLTLPFGIETIDGAILSGNTTVKELRIPSTLKSGSNLTAGSAVEKVVFEDGIETIPSSVLANSTTLREVVIPMGVKMIDSYAFQNSGLQSLLLPASVGTIGYSAFENSGLRSLVVPEGVTSIESSAFSGCTNLQEIALPASVKTIGDEAFANSGLQSLILPQGIEELGQKILAGNTGVTEIVIPGSVKTMRYYDYHGSGYGVFTDSAIRRAVIMEGVTTIGFYAFYDAKQLTEIVLPNTVESVETSAFSGTSLTDVYFHGALEEWEEISIGSYNDPLLSATLHTVSDEIASGICGDCLRWVFDTESVLTISGTGAMYDFENTLAVPWHAYENQIKKVIVSSGVTTIGDHAFEHLTNLNRARLASSLITIGDDAFRACSAVSITVPTGVTTLGNGVFADCDNLTTVYIPRTLETIGTACFTGSGRLSNIQVLSGGSTFYVSNGALYRQTDDCLICFPAGQTAPSFAIPQGVTEISDYAFFGCVNLKRLTIAPSVKVIGAHAFEGCSGIVSAHFPNGMEIIGESAFANCDSLAFVSLPESMLEMGKCAFSACTSLGAIQIPADITVIEDETFSECTGLESVSLSENLSRIGERAFQNCSMLNEIEIPATVMSIGDSAFSNCADEFVIKGYQNTAAQTYARENGITFVSLNGNSDLGPAPEPDFVLPGFLVEIEDEAFEGCQFTCVKLQDMAEKIGNKAFADCRYLKHIIIPGSITWIAENAFENVPDGLIIHGYEGSYAQFYAGKYGYLFSAEADEIEESAA